MQHNFTLENDFLSNTYELTCKCGFKTSKDFPLMTTAADAPKVWAQKEIEKHRAAQQQTNALIDRYIDKEHAVGIIWCLQNHFAQIADRLDSIGVPTDFEREDGTRVPLTAQQRVALLIEASGRCEWPNVNWDDIVVIVTNGADGSGFPFEPEEIDGEDVAMIIHGDKPEPWRWGEWHNVNG